MDKAEARKLLNVNNKELADILCVSASHLSRIPDLSMGQVKIVQGELAKVILKDAVETIEKLENERDMLQAKLEQVIQAAKSNLNS